MNSRPREFWDTYMQGYDTIGEFRDYTDYLDELADSLALLPGEAVLDAGIGTGNFALRLAERGAEVVGVDFSREALQAYCRKSSRGIAVEASLEEPLPFADAVFDRVTCLSVLFTLSRPGCALALREFRRVLKPGGDLVVTAMRPGQSKTGRLWRHLRQRYAVQPAWSFLQELAGQLSSLTRMMYHNSRMRRLADCDCYRQISAGQLRAEVSRAGFAEISCGTTFNGFFHLLRARSPQRATASGDARTNGDGGLRVAPGPA